MAFHLLDFTDEILLEILQHLSADNALAVLRGPAQVCRRLRRLCAEPSLCKDVGVRVEVTRGLEFLYFGTEEEKRRFLAEESTLVRTMLERMGLHLHSGTIALRVTVRRTTPAKAKGERWKRLLAKAAAQRRISKERAAEASPRGAPRPRYQDVLEEVLRERCPGLEGLHLTGLALNQHGDCAASMPKVRLLSYDVSTADELHGQWQPREEWRREYARARAREAYVAFHTSPLRKMEIRNSCPSREYSHDWHLHFPRFSSRSVFSHAVTYGARPFSQRIEEVVLVGFHQCMWEYLEKMKILVQEEGGEKTPGLPRPVYYSAEDNKRRWRRRVEL